MKTNLSLGLRVSLLAMTLMSLVSVAQAQVTLTGNTYVQDFNSISNGLPTGWSVRTGATATGLGTAATAGTGGLPWSDTTGNFKNCASAAIGSSASTATQGSTADRVLAVRQTGSFGDPGASFAVQIANTSGFTNVQLALDLEMLNIQTRSTTWVIDYGLGDTPTSFTQVATYGDPGVFGITHTNINFNGALDGIGQSIWIRISALSASANSGSRDLFGIDNFTLTYGAGSLPTVPPTITNNPVSTSGYLGASAGFSVLAGGPSLSYQWYFTNNGTVTTLDTATGTSLTMSQLTNENAGGYFVIVSNAYGQATSSVANLTILQPILTNIAYLRTLQSTNPLAPTNANITYKVRGVVTTYVNMTTTANRQFYMQDATGGLAVFVAGGAFSLPNNGDYVEVVGPLGHFSGLFELNLVATNPVHTVTVISNGAPLPAPIVLNLANATNTSYMEPTIEGARVVVKNVNIQGGGSANFTSGANLLMTNATDLVTTFPLRVDTRVLSVVGTPIPGGAVDVIGVMAQNSGTPYYTNYQLLILQPTDITATASAATVNIAPNGNGVLLSWSDASYQLQSSTSVTGAYNTVSSSSPYSDTTNAGQSYYRLVK